ncbi:hypothetical protein IGI04_029833 [Brassica rapa subsp. trilocularis]|uniref:Uncharacterized protein n=1 Tax=Brassica rapa subsp. trilocularis TaxID=1813537 RepID=A0ABQ7LNY6_BRACM|nr:hypothetical protein IGI04_029833 [Brassica rapa subsp. trilocularis]
MVFQMTIYHVWRERNERRHQMKGKTADQLHKVIDKTMRNRIACLKYTGSTEMMDYCRDGLNFQADRSSYTC